jgi:DUF1365 family protein
MKSCLYRGEIEHRRFTPVSNSFSYSVLYYFLDLDEVESIFRFPFLMSYNSPGILSFWRKDYLGSKNQSLKESVSLYVTEVMGKKCMGPIRLMTNISYFGYCMNPVSFYYCYDADGKDVEFIVSEITNTPWGEKHRQVFEMKGSDIKVHRFPKAFHVSPFMPMTIDYTWVFNTPNDELKILMQNRNANQTQIIFDSTLTLKQVPLTLTNVILSFLSFPLVTFKTIFAIHYQALKLYIKKSPVYDHPHKEKVL